MSKIYVYADAGVDGFSLKQLFTSLKGEVDLSSYTIVRMDAEKLASSPWEKDAAMVVFPGGRDLYYCESLHGNGGAKKLQTYVKNGGRYLGICAGAYFAADSIDFEKGGELEVCGERQLKFYPGIAHGPAYKDQKFSYASHSGLRAAHIATEDGIFHAYFNGGCAFVDPDLYPQVKVLGRYSDLPGKPAAIVCCTFGKGLAILSGVHIEHPSEHIVEHIGPLLIEKNEIKRRKLWGNVLQEVMSNQNKL